MRAEETLIIGAGPAGIAAAIQLYRSRVPFTLLEKERVGGLLWNANLVENYPGFPNGISGPRLAGLFEKQLRRTGVPVSFDRVSSVDFQKDGFLVLAEQASYHPRYLIVATGTKSRPLPIPFSEAVRDKIFTEVFPLLEAQDQHIVIVGAGDAAFDYALNLAKRNRVSILHRNQQASCLPLLWEKAVINPRITYQDRTSLARVEAIPAKNRLRLVGLQRMAPFEIECDGLIYAIGREPQVDLLSPQLIAEKTRLERLGRLYLVGDVVNGSLRQTAIAVGDGLRAAMHVCADITGMEAHNL